MRIVVIDLLFLLLALPGVAVQRWYYTGTIGTAHAVQMDVAFDAGAVSGRYAYDSVGTDLELTGTLRNRTVTMREKADDQVTGRFTCRLSADYRTVSGSWTSADGRRTLPVALTAVASYRVLSVKKKGYDLTAVYPVFLAKTPAFTSLNAQLAARAKEAQRKFLREVPQQNAVHLENTQDYEITIAYYHPQLVSLLISEDGYTGGAHGYYLFASANYQLTGDTPTLLGLNDLFTKERPYRETLFTLVMADLHAQLASEGAEAFEELTSKILTVYTLSPTSITFYFAPYVVSSYAAGSFQVTIPYRAVLAEINWRGPLRQFFRPGGPGTAASQDPVTGLRADEVAALGSDAFVERYVALTGVQESWGVRDALWAYADLKQAQNDRLAAALPTAQQPQYARMAAVTQRLLDTHYAVEEQVTGGTLLLDLRAGDAAELADLMGDALQTLRTPTPPDPAKRQQARADLSAAAAAARPATSALRRAVADAHTLAQELPDQTAVLLAAFTLRMATVGENEEAAGE